MLHKLARRGVWCRALMGIALWAGAAAAQAHTLSESLSAWRIDGDTVRLQFTVADERGKLIRDLSASDVEVFDDQAQVKRFSDFERDDNLPLQLGLVLDTSDSVKRVLPQEKRAAVDFVERVMRPQSDVAYVMAVAGDVKTWQKAQSVCSSH